MYDRETWRRRLLRVTDLNTGEETTCTVDSFLKANRDGLSSRERREVAMLGPEDGPLHFGVHAGLIRVERVAGADRAVYSVQYHSDPGLAFCGPFSALLETETFGPEDLVRIACLGPAVPDATFDYGHAGRVTVTRLANRPGLESPGPRGWSRVGTSAG